LVIDPLGCVLYISDASPKILVHGKELKGMDVVIPRVGTYATSYVLAVIRQFDLMGVALMNNHSSIARSKNKLGCLQLLAQNAISVPETLISRYPRHLSKLIELLGGTPVIMKLLRGTQGVGVIISETRRSVESVLDTIWSLGEDILLQRFIQESEGRDIRVMVIGDKVCAAMRRNPRKGEFRSNIHRGGVGEVIKLPRSHELLAIRAAKVLGLQLAGVDIIESRQGPMVVEVNSSPGFQGLEQATGINIAGRIIRHAASLRKGS
jgi:ribosomal protein S6--L-glutamate ligase